MGDRGREATIIFAGVVVVVWEFGANESERERGTKRRRKKKETISQIIWKQLRKEGEKRKHREAYSGKYQTVWKYGEVG